MPVYSVADAEEARALLVAACPTNLRGQFVAPELVEAQNFTTLAAFSDRLDEAHARLREGGRCRC
jgi:hypothetical protein